MANHNFELLIAPTLAALANEPDVLVVATTGGRPVDAFIPGAIPSNARVASFLPFEWLLPRVDVLVTNGGYGSVNLAMSYGIPLVTAGMTDGQGRTSTHEWRGRASVSISQPTSRRQKRCAPPSAPCSIDPPTECARRKWLANSPRIDTRSAILSIISEVVAHHMAVSQRAETMATSQPRRAAQQR